MRVAILPLFMVSFAAARAQSNHFLPLQGGAPVKDAPYTAVRTLDYEPATDSLDAVAVHGEETISRDANGRLRSEIRYGDALPHITIMDLVSGMRYAWAAGDTVVRATAIKPPSTPAVTREPEQPLEADAPLIEGVKTRHQHSVTGTEAARKIVDSWYSPELHLAMLTIIDEPGVGRTTYRFQHLIRGEPDASLFKAPSGSTIDDAKMQPPPVQPPAGSAASTAASRPAYLDDPKFQKALDQAKAPRQTVDDQLENWKHANKIAHDACVECLHKIVNLQAKAGAIKDEVKTAAQLEAVAASVPHEKYFAEAMRGGALITFNQGQPKPEQLSQAVAALQDVLAYSPKSREVIYQLGRALAMQGKNDEAKTMFDRYVDIVPASDKFRARAERFSDDPHLATLPMAPPFRLVTSEGQEMQLDDMNGRVVLLDFWATWCGPCKQTLPEMQRIAKDYASDPMLVIISVSSDKDANVWRDFLQKNNMSWPQYRDNNGTLSEAYGVSTIPRFFTIDTNGVLKSEQVGSGADVRSVVVDLVKKAHKAEAQQAKGTDRAKSSSEQN